MGNACLRSASVDIPVAESRRNTENSGNAVGSGQKYGGTGKDSSINGNNNNNNNNNNAGKEICEPCMQGEEHCADYVRKALDGQRVTAETIFDYSESLQSMPGDELLFNFENVTINTTAVTLLDEPDQGELMQVEPGQAAPGLITSEIRPIMVADVGAAVPHIDSEEEIDISTRKTKWQKHRRREFEYALPSDKYSAVYEDKMDVRGSNKRKIIAISDLHLGGSWSTGMDRKLEIYLDGILEMAKEEVACFVLLGDIFEMWLDKFPEVPPTNEQRVVEWKESATVLRTAVDKLVSECAVSVYYIRGNHDHEITEEDVAAIFGTRITFVPCTLILRVQTEDDYEHRIRFAHGHEWDVFNSYVLHQTDNLLPNRPIGYYIARAVATSGGGDSGSELEDILIGLASSMLAIIPASLEDNMVDSLLDPSMHRKLMSRLFEGAFKVKDIEFLIHAKCRIAEDKWIRLQTMIEYPLLRLCGSLVGKQDVFHMIKASTGDYKRFVQRTDEDVIVLAHTHRWDMRKYGNNRGNQVIYANTGCWTNNCDEFSTVVLCPPTADGDGSVLIDYGKNMTDGV